MGIWDWFSDKIQDAKDWASEKVENVKDWTYEKMGQVKDLYDSGKEKVKTTVNHFTGRTDFEKAKVLYEDISRKYKERQELFEAEVDQYVSKIQNTTERINQLKQKINTELLTQAIEKLEKLADTEIIGNEVIESYEYQKITVDRIRTRQQLFKIDFDRHKVKTAALSVITLGFLTRKRAKQTLQAVEEEKLKLELEMKKMDAEVLRLKNILMSLENIESYFIDLVQVYERLLVRVDNSIQHLAFHYANKLLSFMNGKMSIKHLPKVQVEEISALITVGHILGEMTRLEILCESDHITKQALILKQQNEEGRIYYEAV